MIKIDRRWTYGLTGLFAAALIITGCAASHMPGPEPAPAPEPSRDGDHGADQGLEEIVVTGTKVERPRSRRYGGRSADGANQSTAGSSNMMALYDNAAPHEALPYTSDEEIWVIQKPTATSAVTPTDDPGTGSMVATVDSEEVPLPLQHTGVTAQINGYISTVNVRQEFSNPFDSKIEAVYLFPLPEKAAVSEFLMIIGERKIRGILREKEEAKEIYEAARSQGYRASLMVQHRPNIFEQKVANIEPGKSIDVDIKYFHTLSYNDGWYSFVFPTVVGPRYNPPGHSDPIKALPRQDTTTQDTGVRYLRPDERSGHDISIDVSISAGVEIEELRSTHKIVATQDDEQSASVQLAAGATIPNKDFILDFRVAGETMKSDLLTYVDPETQQGYFTMMLYPPEVTDKLERRNMEMVFVIDASGSMSGTPMDQAKGAVLAALDHLQEGDTFQIIRFSSNASQFGEAPVPATKQNIKKARRYVQNLSGGGGTQMIEGVKAALDFPHDPARLRFVSFLTDGYIGNEAQILGEVHKRIGASRIFSFGVGSSVNRYLMERMAKIGKGAVAYLGPQDSGYEIMDGFFNRISHPALTDVRIDWQGMAVSDVYPSVLPDVFVGRPIVVTGKYLGHANDVRILGRQGNRDHSVIIESSNDTSSAPQLAKTWARMRIAELEDRKTWSADPYDEIGEEIKATALQHQLMSDYTSYVAVDTSERTEGEYGTTVHQAVPVPDGVRYDTTVEEN
ncbi:MAG: VWA domain-containing protein [Chromatiales bacterium]|nr:MAG: VWA domain-containing protein [Chromatiales bacterium]